MTIRPEFTKRQSIVVITVMVWLADGVVSSMVVPRMPRVVRQLNWQPAQWDQSQRNVPVATGVWPTTLEFTHP